jgi:hypothetical protein
MSTSAEDGGLHRELKYTQLRLEHEERLRLQKDREIEELRSQVEDMDSEREYVVKPMMEVHHDLLNMKVKAGKAALEAAKTKCPIRKEHTVVPTRRMGAMDSSPSGPMSRALQAGQLTNEDASRLHALTRNPNFRPMRVDCSNPDAPIEVVDRDHEQVRQVRLKFGDEVAEDLLRAVIELEKWNPSGRYPILVPWHEAEQRELSPAEVIQCLAKAVIFASDKLSESGLVSGTGRSAESEAEESRASGGPSSTGGN